MPRVNHPILPDTYCYFNEITDWGKQRWQVRLNKLYKEKRTFKFWSREKAIEFLHMLGFDYE